MNAYDIIIIGAGPAGLIAACFASDGIPWINMDVKHRVLLLEKQKTGGIAKDINLKFSKNWILPKNNLIELLKKDIESEFIDVHEREEVIEVNLKGNNKIIKTKANEYSAKAVIIAVGIFPFSNLIHKRGVTALLYNDKLQRKILTNLKFLDNTKNNILVVGSSDLPYETLKTFKSYFSKAKIFPVIENTNNKNFLDGKLENVINKGEKIVAQINLKGVLKNILFDHVIIDYNSYKKLTTTTKFLLGKGIKMKNGFIDVDNNFLTNIKGVFACGNISTRISGALTAVSSASIAGLGAYEYVYKKKFKKEPNLFPMIYKNI